MSIATNLTHQQLWRDVRALEISDISAWTGIPPKKLHPDDSDKPEVEFVIGSSAAQSWSIAEWANAFAKLAPFTENKTEPRRAVLAMVADDSTVAYYILYNGLQNPRKH